MKPVRRENIPELPWQSLEAAEAKKKSTVPAAPLPHPPQPRRPPGALDPFKFKGPIERKERINPSRPYPNLGKRILSTLAGDQVFREVVGGGRRQLLPVRADEALLGRVTMKDVTKELGLS